MAADKANLAAGLATTRAESASIIANMTVDDMKARVLELEPRLREMGILPPLPHGELPSGRDA